MLPVGAPRNSKYFSFVGNSLNVVITPLFEKTSDVVKPLALTNLNSISDLLGSFGSLLTLSRYILKFDCVSLPTNSSSTFFSVISTEPSLVVYSLPHFDSMFLVINHLIADVYKQVGKDGVVTVENSQTADTFFEIKNRKTDAE